MTTWKPVDTHRDLNAEARKELPESAYAFPKIRKEPLTDETHVRNSITRFDQVEGVTDSERELAFDNIKAAAKHYGIDMTETSWRDLGKPKK
jgi:hypothetical protein